jgi:hypothetical protein
MRARKTKYLSQYRNQERITIEFLLKKLQNYLKKNTYTLTDFQRFIRNDYALTVISLNEDVKMCVYQLSTHPDLPILDKECCHKLLARGESLSTIESYMANLIKYQLIQMEEIKKDINKLHQKIDINNKTFFFNTQVDQINQSKQVEVKEVRKRSKSV